MSMVQLRCHSLLDESNGISMHRRDAVAITNVIEVTCYERFRILFSWGMVFYERFRNLSS